MGGSSSGRWGSERTRLDTSGLLKLDIRILRRQGALRPGVYSTQTWSRRGDPVGTINVQTDRDGQSVTLIYTISGHGIEPETIRETVHLDTTPCNFGGERSWFLCPRCMSRRDVLFSVKGRFRCRACHDLAYTSTREDELGQIDRRIWKIAEQLGYTGSDFPFRLPNGGKPRYMHWNRYEALVGEWIALHNARNRYFGARAAVLEDRVNALLNR